MEEKIVNEQQPKVEIENINVTTSKPSRQVLRQEQRKKEKLERSIQKKLNSPMSFNDFSEFMKGYSKELDETLKNIGRIVERSVTQLQLVFNSLEKLLIDKGLISLDELQKYYNSEINVFLEVNTILSQTGDYENRIKRLIDLGIDVKRTDLLRQIEEDTNLSEQEKKNLIETYFVKINTLQT